MLDPAVHTRLVRHLDGSKEEGTAASPGVRKRYVSRMFRDTEKERENVPTELVVQAPSPAAEDQRLPDDTPFVVFPCGPSLSQPQEH